MLLIPIIVFAALAWWLTATLHLEWWMGVLIYLLVPIPIMALLRSRMPASPSSRPEAEPPSRTAGMSTRADDPERPDWTRFAHMAILGLHESAKEHDTAQMSHFLERLHEIAVRAPFPKLARDVELLAQSEDETVKKLALERILAWTHATLEGARGD